MQSGQTSVRVSLPTLNGQLMMYFSVVLQPTTLSRPLQTGHVQWIWYQWLHWQVRTIALVWQAAS